MRSLVGGIVRVRRSHTAKAMWNQTNFFANGIKQLLQHLFFKFHSNYSLSLTNAQLFIRQFNCKRRKMKHTAIYILIVADIMSLNVVADGVMFQYQV